MFNQHFLGWNKPFLWSLTEWLAKTEPSFDFRGIILTLESRRAQRRILELLSFKAEEHGEVLLPPLIISPSDICHTLRPPDTRELYSHERLLIWNKIRANNSSLVERIISSPNNLQTDTFNSENINTPEDFVLLTYLDKIREETCNHNITTEKICSSVKHLSDSTTEEKWTLISELFLLFNQYLVQHNLQDKYLLAPIVNTSYRYSGLNYKKIILAACAHITPYQIKLCESLGIPGEILIFSPPEHADGFNSYGGIQPEYWHLNRSSPNSSQLHFINSPLEAPSLVAGFAETALQNEIPESHISIGVLSPELTAPLLFELDTKNISGVAPGIQSLRDSGVGRFILSVCGVWSGGEKCLPELITHPLFTILCKEYLNIQNSFDMSDTRAEDTELFNIENLENSTISGILAEDIDQLLKETLSCNILQADSLAKERKQRLLFVSKVLNHYNITRLSRLGTIPEFTNQLQNLIYAVTNHLCTVPNDNLMDLTDENQLIEDQFTLLRGLNEAVQILSNFSDTNPELPDTLSSQVFHSLIRDHFFLTETAPPDSKGIEILGWYELLLDDSVATCLALLNEDFIPVKINPDPFLPNSLRRSVGLPHNESLFGHDAYQLSAILNSKSSIKIFAARKAQSGDLMKISRLALSTEKEKLIETLSRFYSENTQSTNKDETNLSNYDAPSSPQDLIQSRPIPAPECPYKKFPLPALSVSAIKNYIRCPYEFYLRYLLGVEIPDFGARELNSASLGTILHLAFAETTRSTGRRPDSANDIYDLALSTFNKIIDQRFGNIRPLMLELQLENIRKKLLGFSKWEHESKINGWINVATELKLPAKKIIPLSNGETISISGTIDRIDYIPHQNIIKITDFKTSDMNYSFRDCISGDSWIDPQLPLYSFILEKNLDALMENTKVKILPDPTFQISLVSIDRRGNPTEDLYNPDKNDISNCIALATEIAENILSANFHSIEGLSNGIYHRLFGTSGDITQENLLYDEALS